MYRIVGISVYDHDIYMYLSAYFVLFQDSHGQGGRALAFGRGPPPQLDGAPTALEPPIVGYVGMPPPTVSLYLYVILRTVYCSYFSLRTSISSLGQGPPPSSL